MNMSFQTLLKKKRIILKGKWNEIGKAKPVSFLILICCFYMLLQLSLQANIAFPLIHESEANGSIQFPIAD